MKKYTFSNGFYEDGEEKYSFRQALKYNWFIFKQNEIKNRLHPFKSDFREFKLNFEIQKVKFIRKIEWFFVPKIIVLKLKLKGRKICKIQKSPYSESVYVIYDYLDSCVKIRISSHSPSKNDNSNIYVFV